MISFEYKLLWLYSFCIVSSAGNFQSSCCFKLVEAVDSAITKWNLDSGSSPNLLRVVVSSYGSPFWQLEDGDDTSSTFTRALMLLKALVRSANAVAIVTIPHHLLNVHSKHLFKLS